LASRTQPAPTMANDIYFQFPLCLLAFNRGDLRASLSGAAITWSIDAISKSDRIRDPPTMNASWKNGWRRSWSADRRTVAAAAMLNVRLGSRGRWESELSATMSFLRNFEGRFGTDRQVRLAADIVWECIHGKVAERDIRVLASVFAALGVRPYRRITLDEIIHGASGCKSSSVFEQWSGRIEPLSRDQVRYTLDGLEGRKLFVRFTFRHRQTFYASAGMGRDALIAAVTKAKLAKATAVARRVSDSAASNAVLARIGALTSPQPHNSRETPHNSEQIPDAPTIHPNIVTTQSQHRPN